MRITLFLLFFGILFSQAANSYSQETSFTLYLKSASIKEICEEIEKKSDYRFIFAGNARKIINKQVDLTANSQDIDEILDNILSNTELTYRKLDDQIVIYRSEKKYNSEEIGKIVSELITQQQKKQITGTVTDIQGEPIIGANIVQQGTANGTITDVDGSFSLQVENEAVLHISYIGYLSQEINSAGKTAFDIILLEDTKLLDEVVVTALGIKRQTKALSYSSSEISGEDLGESSDVNIMNSLAGKIAGVDVSTLGTGLAGSSRVLIRGSTTINGDSNPLYVIDGMPINRSSMNSRGRDYGDALNTINSDDIESISVLKGAGATALYGSQAANGVVLITTKSGSQRQGLGITYSGTFGFDEYVNPFRNRQTTYGVGVEATKPDIDQNGWGYNAHQEWGAKYDGSVAYYPDNVTPVPHGYSYYETHWDEFTRSGFYTDNSIAISGGTKTQNYRLSVSDLHQLSPLPNSDMNRQTLSLTTSTLIGKKFNIDAKLDYSTMEMTNRPNTQSYVWTLGHMPTMWDIEWAKGKTSKIGANEAGNMLPWSTNEYYHNPYWAAYQNETMDERDRINGLISGKFDINDWLYITGRLGVDLNVTKVRDVEAYGATQFSQGTGQVEEFTNKNERWNGDYSIVFKKDIRDFKINAMLGGSFSKSFFNRDGLTGTKLSIPYFHEISNASVLNTNISHSKFGINSLYGSAEMSYKDFLYLNITGRNDWFSSLSSENNSISYPSVGISYLFSEQFNLPDWISFGKLRGSYAQVGGGASPYMTKFGYSSNALGYAGYPLLSLPNSIPKSDLMPYETREYEVGVDLRLFDNRVHIDYAYYDKLTRNDIVLVSTPPSSGYGSATVNLGEMGNKGHEILLNLVPVKGSFTWDITFAYTHNLSKVLDLGGANELEVTGYGDAAGVTVKQIIGEKFSSIVGYSQAIDEASGQPIWYWNASRNIWFPQKTEEPQILGTGLHPNMGSFSTSLSYKGIILSTMIDAKWGAKVFSYSEWDMTSRGHSKRTVEYRETGIPIEGVYLNAAGTYVPLDHDTNIPYKGNNFENYYRYGMGDLVSFNLFDASYVRLREISLGYTIPTSILKNGIVRSTKLSLVGRNLCNFYNKIPNGDASTLNNNGLERFALPSTRSFLFNISLSF